MDSERLDRDPHDHQDDGAFGAVGVVVDERNGQRRATFVTSARAGEEEQHDRPGQEE